jgi:hypothetical protein
MKRENIFVIALVLLMMGAGVVFAQQDDPTEEQTQGAPKERKNALALDLFPLFKGFIAWDFDEKTYLFNMSVSYERLLAPHFSIGAQVDMFFGRFWNSSYFYYAMGLLGRYYPMSETFEKFFLGAGLGFNAQAVGGRTRAEYGGFLGLTAMLQTGYKLIFSPGIFVEPSLSYVLSKSDYLIGMAPLGWQGGLRLGFAF